MVYMSGGKAARNAASITNRATCGGPKKGGLMGYIGGVGTGGVANARAASSAEPVVATTET